MIDAISMRIVLAVLVVVALAYTLHLARREGRGSVAAAWAGSLAAFSTGTVLFLGDGTPLQPYTAAPANMAAVLGGCMMIATARRLRGATLPWWLFATVTLGAGAATLLEDPVRNSWAGGGYMLFGLGACSAYTAASLWRHRSPRSAGEVRSLALTASGLAAFYALRCALFVTFGPDSAAFTTFAGSGLTALVQVASISIVTVAVAHLDASGTREELARRATTDDLTGVLNRGELLEQAERMLASSSGAARDGVAVVISDLDHFKDVNDTHGHGEGDRALRAFAQAWTDALRQGDVVGRIGGDEFVVVIPGITAERAAERATVVTRRFVERAVSDGYAAPTASHGVSIAAPGSSFANALARADEALYEAKRAGRGVARVYGPADQSSNATSMPSTVDTSPRSRSSRM
ncbi:GGDEF domain-containing protein [Demequina mangrovi]|uniref:Diguanylate cyclase (GGDEF) domain-containing protein n=1 Tax=Demequina mangrovi TaxID=1043493 RepID=A0A1H6TTY6_9MICO|nr:GGDEF domain-containing protein [Demequina mangrovi]SEI81654.1 diguanylate cyclase (GGDEF) domain-containing protein [Demequina mangrovi]